MRVSGNSLATCRFHRAGERRSEARVKKRTRKELKPKRAGKESCMIDTPATSAAPLAHLSVPGNF